MASHQDPHPYPLPEGEGVHARVVGGMLHVPSLVNAHSHAFQRAIVGMTECVSKEGDDFWSWRERMYAVALRISPEQLEAIASFLYAEMLCGGYSHVCEFHYLHNDTDGQPYADPLEMSMALVRAAQRTGIGLTLLPTLYMHAGFGEQALKPEQRRFASTPETVLNIAHRINALKLPRVNAGVALHSLRAVDLPALQTVEQEAKKNGWPVHIHISEQMAEVDACLAAHGQRPINYLLSHVPIDARWNLLHATHANQSELQALAKTGASIVLCPSTEANLGDGIFDAPTWLQAGGTWSIGSDSHVCRSAAEELRLLEYGQRLAQRQRNVWASSSGQLDTAQALLSGALKGGAAASGVTCNPEADFCVYPIAAGTTSVSSSAHLSHHLFNSPTASAQEVFVSGKKIEQEMHCSAFEAAMRTLWT